MWLRAFTKKGSDDATGDFIFKKKKFPFSTPDSAFTCFISLSSRYFFFFFSSFFSFLSPLSLFIYLFDESHRIVSFSHSIVHSITSRYPNTL
jgi:hypothetical protein